MDPALNLIDAVKTNNLEHVRLLMEQGADKDKADASGYTHLYWAARKGYFEVAQYLVEQGATLDKAAINGDTPLIFAAIIGHLEVPTGTRP